MNTVNTVRLTVNGLSKQVIVDHDTKLLDFLRDGMRLTGAKRACDDAGQCGACTVLVNGKAVRACLTKLGDLEGAEVLTVEGLGTPAAPHPIQEAFVLSGAVQCGYCTPGAVMGAKALLDRNADPSTAEIKRAMRGHLCRCTGYVNIVDAVRLAGRFLRGECAPAEVRPDPAGPKLGVSHPRPSSMAKACGVADFTADLAVPGALEAAVVRSPYAHARIRSIDGSAAERMAGVRGVMTAKDIRGTNRLLMFVNDRQLLCDERVRCIGDPVAIVVAETQAQALAAARAVVVDYERLPEILTTAAALAEGAPKIHDEFPNLCYQQPLVRGDAEAALANSAAVVEARFTTQINHQAPLEPEAALAYIEGEGEDAQLVVVGRSINIHKAMSMIQDAVGWENTRYVEAYAGGQFGVKIEITSEGIAAAAAVHFQKPVRYVPGLAETLAMTPKRHPFDMHIRLGADAGGRLTGLTLDYVVDNGAYTSIGKTVVNRALWMLCGSYHVPDVRACGKLVYTNNPWGSAARGAGPPQQHLALECAMDMLAGKLGIDPLEFRRRNSLQPGQVKSSGPPVEQWPFPELCEAIRPHYERGRRDAAGHRSGAIRRGVGLGAGAFGVGGSGDMSTVAVEIDPDGGISIYAAVADPGEGNDSMLTQLTADAMGIGLDQVRLVVRDTDRTTASGPAAGSRITLMMGGALLDALDQLKQALAETGQAGHEGLTRAGRPTRYVGKKKNPDGGPMDPKTGQGPNFDTQIHAVQMAEVEVNTETGEVTLLKMTCAVDAGTVFHPQNVIGQLHGGMDQGAGYALREEFVAGKSRDWITFKFPTMRTAFDMEVILRETPRVRGPKGATGIGEMTMVPTAPAIVNAIHDACGVWIQDLPATPARVKAALARER